MSRNKAIDTEPPTARLQMDDRPRRPGHRNRYPNRTDASAKSTVASATRDDMFGTYKLFPDVRIRWNCR